MLGIVSFKTGRFEEMFDWTTTTSSYHYMPPWVREIGAMLQLLPLILVPFVAVVQSCRYVLYVDSSEVRIWKHYSVSSLQI